VETGFRVRRVLDDHLAIRKDRQLVVVARFPTVVGIDGPPLGRNDLPQIQLDLPQLPLLIELGLKGDAFRQGEHRLAPHLPAQGIAHHIARRDGQEQDRPRHRLQPEAVDHQLGPRILPGIKPGHPGPSVSYLHSILTAPPGRRCLILLQAQRVRLVMRHTGKAVLAPRPRKITNLKPAANGNSHFQPILEHQHVTRRELAQPSFPAHGRVQPPRPGLASLLRRRHIGCMHKDQPTGATIGQIDLRWLSGNYHGIVHLKRDAPAHAYLGSRRG